jgi:hypothetical protein
MGHALEEDAESGEVSLHPDNTREGREKDRIAQL